MSDTVKPPWSHIPDAWLIAAISVQAIREHFALMWIHLAECSVCRDRYWEFAQKAIKGQLLQMAADIVPLPDMPASISELLGSLFGTSDGMVTCEEAALVLLAHVEKMDEDEPLTADNILVEGMDIPEFNDPSHIEKCPTCQSKVRSLLNAIRSKAKDMPNKAKIINKLVQYLEQFVSVKSKKEEPLSKEHHADLDGFAM